MNTIDDEMGRDDIVSPDLLVAWFAARAVMRPEERIGEGERRRAVALREALRALLAVNNGAPSKPAAHALLDREAVAAPLRVRFDGGDAALAPLGSGFTAVVRTLLAICLDAMIQGTWTQLKSCRSDQFAGPSTTGRRTARGHGA